jgi:hypothetical protein
MRSSRRRVPGLLAALAGLASACAPGPTFDGTWESERLAADPEGYWVLTLTQDDEDVSGAACHVERGRIQDNPEIVGRHPYVFIPFAPDADLILKIDGEDRMSATLRGYEVGTFHRAAAAEYQECMSAPRAQP